MKKDDPRLQFSLYSTREGIEGLTCIFYCKGSLWKNNNTFYQAFMKGLTCLEAYEAHLRTENRSARGIVGKLTQASV